MIIKLYRDCILTNSYNEVIHHQVMEDYLDTLESVQFDLDYSYQENSGMIVLDLSLREDNLYYNIYNYNYMKLTEIDIDTQVPIFTRYAFIDRIEIANQCAKVYYSEDIWSSYSSKLNVRDSLLSRSKITAYTNNPVRVKTLPIEYAGNLPFKIQLLGNGTLDDKYIIVVQSQVYRPREEGEQTQRRTDTSVVYQAHMEGNLRTISRLFNFEEALKYIDGLAQSQSSKCYAESDDYRTGVYHTWLYNHFVSVDQSQTNFQIDNITLIPYKMIDENILFSNENFKETYSYTDDGTLTGGQLNNGIFPVAYINIYKFMGNYDVPVSISGRVLLLSMTTDNQYIGKKLLSAEYIVPNNFKFYSMGTLNRQFEIENNGLAKRIDITMMIDNLNFNIFLEFDDRIENITNDFVVEIPYETLLGEEASRLKQERYYKRISSAFQVAEGSLRLIGNAYASYNRISVDKGYLARARSSKKKQLWSSRINAQRGEALSGSASALGNITDGIIGFQEANIKGFSSQKGTFTTSTGTENAKYGICIFKIDDSTGTDISRTNIKEVDDLVNNAGYDVFLIGGNELLENYKTPSNNYNVMKFDFVKCYGAFTQEINDGLKSILLNGFKIYYDENV